MGRHEPCVLLQARQQSVEEVNQRWAAKSHGLLSRIAQLEQQLAGGSRGQPAEGPIHSAQVSHPPAGLVHTMPAEWASIELLVAKGLSALPQLAMLVMIITTTMMRMMVILVTKVLL